MPDALPDAISASSVLVTHVTERLKHLVVLHHGIDGDAKDLHAIRHAIERRGVAGVECWETRANEGKTHAGIFACADRVWTVLLPLLTHHSGPLRVSFVGHSMGGLVLRAVAAKLHGAAMAHVTLDTLVVVASPHLGCRLLGRGGAGYAAPLMANLLPSLMRAGLRVIKGAIGPQLLLDDTSLDELCNEAHCASLRAFRRRVTYANGTGDWLVNCESCSLLTKEELDAIVPVSEAACRQPGAAVLWRPSATACADAALPSTLQLSQPSSRRRGDDPRAPLDHTKGAVDDTTSAVDDLRILMLRPLPEESIWDERATVRAHTTWDDVRAWRGKRAARLLWLMRGCGEWELHLCHFFKRSSSDRLGLLLVPHIDLVALPHKVTRQDGLEVVDHIVAGLLSDAGG